MGKTITQKIIEPHIVEGAWKPGSEIAIRVDQTLTQDATGTMAYLQFEAMGLSKIATDLSVSYIDHNTIQVGYENADDHKYLQSIAAKYGIVLSRAGNGICHQVHLERFGKPGKTLLGSDSHTPTGGGIGMIAIGAGGLDVAMAMGGAPFYLACPKVVRINLIGKLKPWVSAKDVILKILDIFTVKGNVGVVFEYGGPGVATLSVPERATITNMGAECGVTTSLFPSDEVTRGFLAAQRRAKDWIELVADKDAAYEKIVDIDLAKIVPLVAIPHSPGNIKTVKDVAGLAVDQVCVGSCTNSSYKDLVTVAKIMKGKTVPPNVSFVIAPGSKQVLQNITRDGYLADLLAAGGRLVESACGFCIGNSQSPSTRAVSIRTSNRNFEGRSGTKDAQVYLASPETAAACALTGKITDPRNLKARYPKVMMPKKYFIDDNLFIFPISEKKRSKIEIFRGPNIGSPPTSNPYPESLSGVVSIKVGDKITTDHIIPAGARMKYRSNVPKYSEYVFETVDATFAARAKEIRDSGKFNIIVSGLSYGQGSSREHAAICPMFLGVKAVLAKSFERIHMDNLVNFGILPLMFKDEADYNKIEQGDQLEIPDARRALEQSKPIVIRNLTRQQEYEVVYSLTGRQRDIILAGGSLSLLKPKA